MIGAIAGDIIGSVYEANPLKSKDFPIFSPNSRITDDTVLTLAVADVLLTGKDYAGTYRDYYRCYPNHGYGYGFTQWATNESASPYNSYGNGSAMRVSPVAWVYESIDEVLQEAKYSAQVSHNHVEGIRGAQAVAAAVFMARTGHEKIAISNYVHDTFGYDLNRSLAEIRPDYRFDVTCQGSVPEAIIAFLESCDYEDAVRNAISLGGDSDTMACIAGAIAEAYYRDIDKNIREEVMVRLPDTLKGITTQFINKYCLY